MSGTGDKTLQFNVLDALSVASLPEQHLVKALASRVLSDGSGLPQCLENARRVVELLEQDAALQSDLLGRVLDEVKRQVQLRLERMMNRQQARSASLIGSRLGMSVRVQRVCEHVFGDPVVWRSLRRRRLKLRDPIYYWFHRDRSGHRLSCFIGGAGDVSVTGIVVREQGSESRWFAILPSRAKSIQELIAFVGLGQTLHKDPDADVDWKKALLSTRRIKDLPWTYE